MISVTPLLGEAGGAVITHKDITERKRDERHLLELSGRLINAQEDERARIARELHDDFSQRLALMAMKLEQLSQTPAAADHSVIGRLHMVWERITELSSDIHRLSHRLHSSKLQYVGLLTAAKSLCEETARKHHIQIEFVNHDMPETISPDIALCFFRIVQEALNNIVKHSGAKQARIEFSGASSIIRLRIVDAGVGFDPGSRTAHVGLGLARMRERLRLIGGSLAIRSFHMEGTKIQAEAPTVCITGDTSSENWAEDCQRDDRGSSMTKVKILLADDHLLVAEALKSLLVPTYDVVGTVSDGIALLEAAGALKPDLIVIDIAMPKLNGLDATRQLKRVLPRIKIIILTMNEDTDLVGEAFRAGASGYILKHSASGELMQAIHEVLKGSSYLSPRITGGAVASLLRGPDMDSGQSWELTSRQRQVIQLLAEGRSMKEIADILTISLRTVAAHKYRIMDMLEIKTNAELYRYAVKHRIISV